MATAMAMQPDDEVRPETVRLRIHDLQLEDKSTQIRAKGADEETVKRYAEKARDGHADSFPPIVVFEEANPKAKDHGNLYIADGWTRAGAFLLAGLEEIRADLFLVEGAKREAIKYACGSNEDHGLPRTDEDRRKAVNTLLDDPEWAQLGSRAIAEICHVSRSLVDVVRKERGDDSGIRQRPNGKTMNIRNIGRTQVNGEDRADPQDIRRKREEGRIPIDARVEVHDPGRDATTVDAVREEIEERNAIREDGLTEEEWLDTLPARAKLARRQREIFDADATLYRDLDEARKAWKHKFAFHAGKSRSQGSYYWRIKGSLSVPPPDEWIVCPPTDKGGCDGQGAVLNLGSCPMCKGRGYLIHNT